MRRLAGATELLDGPLEPRLLAGNLRDLARANRWLGGADLSWRALEPILRRRTMSGHAARLLDVGTGAADIPRELLRRAKVAGLRLEVVATDIHREIIELAQRQSAGVTDLELRLSAGELDAPDDSFDIVHCSLLLHHYEPADGAALLREMRRVSARAVVINDLDRARWWWVGAWVLSRVATRNAYTRHDAPLSVRRAYTADEVSVMGAAAGLREATRHRHPLGYRYAIVFSRHFQINE